MMAAREQNLISFGEPNPDLGHMKQDSPRSFVRGRLCYEQTFGG
jgi:hypothetical protein